MRPALLNIFPRAKQNCGNCDAFQREREGASAGLCVAKSPSPFVLNVPNPASRLDPKQPAVTQVVQGIFPSTDDSRWCRDWQASPEGSA
jgi:hypothetical protein